MKEVVDFPIFKHRGWIGILLLVPAGLGVIFSVPVVGEGTLAASLFDAFAFVFFILFVTFRLWSTLFVGGRKDKELATEGPYSVVRNPLYFGSFCFAIAVTLYAKSLLLFGGTIAAVILYSRFVIVPEEEVLEGLFGQQFRDYVRRTPRLIPNFSLYRAPASLSIDLFQLRREAVRVWGACALPIAAQLLEGLRMASWWPHWFRLF